MLIDKNMLDTLSGKARTSERLRMNLNFHSGAESKSQRLLNALEVGTVVPQHRHRATGETYIVLRGALNVFFHDEQGEISATFLLNPQEGVYGVDIPQGQWHSLEVLEQGTTIFEVKDGPYTPLCGEDIR